MDLRVLTDHLLYWILIAGILGYLLPGPAEAGAFLVSWLLFVMVLGLGLTSTLRDFRGALRWQEAIATLAIRKPW